VRQPERIGLRHVALPEVLQQMLEKDIGHEVNLPRRIRPSTGTTFTIQMQGKLMKRKNVDIEKGERFLQNQQTLEGTTQLIRRDNESDRSLGVSGF
jgi:hypothetical protein